MNIELYPAVTAPIGARRGAFSVFQLIEALRQPLGVPMLSCSTAQHDIAAFDANLLQVDTQVGR